MAFCKFCGKPLAEGEVCACTQAAPQPVAAQPAAPQPAAPQPAAPQPVAPQPAAPQQAAPQPAAPQQAAPQPAAPQQAAPQPAAPQQPAPGVAYGSAPYGGAPGAPYYPPVTPKAPNAFLDGLKDTWKLFVAMLKKPVTAAGEFVRNGSQMQTFIMIGIQAIAVMLLLVILGAKFNGIIEAAAAPQLQYLRSIGADTASVQSQIAASSFNILVIILVSLIASVGIAAVIPAIMMLIVKLFKGRTDYNTMLRVSAVNSLVCVPFILVGILAALIFNVNTNVMNPASVMNSVMSAFMWPVLIAMVGCTFGNFLMVSLIPYGSELNQDALPYTMFITSIVTGIVFYILTFVVSWPLCAPDVMKALL